MMRGWLVGLMSTVLALEASAAVICKKKSGAMVVRDAACKSKETAVDLAEFGAVGPAGPKGDKGDPGDAGPLLTTVPSGTTLRGFFGGGATVESSTYVQTTVAYQFPLADNVAIHIVTSSKTPPAECSGDATNPTAAAGHLCVYVGFANSNCDGFGGYGLDGSENYRYGAVIYVGVDSTGLCEFAGTWAVTAP